ncbi:MAG: glycerol-3-phosphate acyltransferase [candidate division WOR-3 bacterium]
MLKYLFSLLSGYILGSILPSYFLGKLLRGIDIRKLEERNAGTLNTYKVLGLTPAILTGLFDTTKGLLAALISSRIGVGYPWCFIASIGTILGHIFPFYLRFKGGQGEATAIGVILYFLFKFLYFKENFWLAFLTLFIFTLSILYIVKRGRIIGIFILPAVTITLLTHATLYEAIFIALPSLHVFITSLKNRIKEGYSLKSSTIEKIKWSRFIARPFAVIYIIIYFYTSKTFILYLSGAVALSFLLFDIIRLSKRGINEVIMKSLRFALKETEEKTFSSMTHFTVAAFLSFLFFAKEIACASIIFPVFGDMFAKLLGLEYGRTKLFNKTLEGTIAYMAVSMTIGYTYSQIISFPYFVILIGSLAAAVSEVLPWELDDNLSGVLTSAIVMHFVCRIFC